MRTMTDQPEMRESLPSVHRCYTQVLHSGVTLTVTLSSPYKSEICQLGKFGLEMTYMFT